MVAIKLIFQTSAGLVAVGGAVGGTVALSNKTATTQTEEQTQQTEKEPESSTIRSKQINTTIPLRGHVKKEIAITEVAIDPNNQTTKDFYLVSPDFESGYKKPEIDLFNVQTPTEKNYQCVKSSQINSGAAKSIAKDTFCVLYSLNVPTNTSLKTSEIQKFIENTNQTATIASKVTQQSHIRRNKFFLLQANDNLIQFEANGKPPRIYLTTKEITSLNYQTNNFVTLKVHAKISTNDVDGKTDTIIAKATGQKQSSTTEADASYPNYQCSFNSESAKTNCKLSKLSSYTPTTLFNFASQTINTNSKTTNTETNAYYFIQSNGIKSHTAKTLKGKSATYFEAQTNISPFSTQLIIEAPVFSKFHGGGTGLSELIILDK